VFTEKKSV